MKPLHGFLQDKKWYEDLGHILLGLAPIGLLLWAREWTDWWMPWPFKGQWPPGDVVKVCSIFDPQDTAAIQTISTEYENYFEEHTQLDRVSDVGRDELGYVIGATIRNVGLLAWWAL